MGMVHWIWRRAKPHGCEQLTKHSERISQVETERFCNFATEVNFGYITDKIASELSVSPGPIRLQQGIHGPRGFGKWHIESTPGRMAQISNLGFPSCERFVYSVARNFQRIGDARDGKLALIFSKNEHDLQVIIRFNRTFWSVVTGLPYRIARCKILTQITRTDGSESPSKAADTPRFEILSLPKALALGDSGS